MVTLLEIAKTLTFAVIGLLAQQAVPHIETLISRLKRKKANENDKPV